MALQVEIGEYGVRLVEVFYLSHGVQSRFVELMSASQAEHLAEALKTAATQCRETERSITIAEAEREVERAQNRLAALRGAA